MKERLDAHFHKPYFKNILSKIQQVPHKTLFEIVEQSSEIWEQSPEKFGEEFPYIEISQVGLGTNEYNVEWLPVANAPSRARMIVHKNEIILSTTRPHRGAIAIIQPEHDGYIASTGFVILRLRNNKKIDLEFLLDALLCQSVLRQFEQRSSGGNYPAITQEQIYKVLIPVPPFSTQQKLVADMQDARDSRRRKLKQADELLSGIDAYLIETLGLTPPPAETRKVFAVRLGQLQGALNPERYANMDAYKTIQGTIAGKVCSIVLEKIIPSRVAPDALWDRIRIDDLPNHPLQIETIETAYGYEIADSFFQVQENDILLARLGPTIQNAKFVLCPSLKRLTVASGEFLVLRCNEGWNPEVVLWILRTKLVRDIMYAKCRGGTPSRYRLNAEDLAQIPFPIISAETQRIIAAEIRQRREEARRLRLEAEAEWIAAKERFEKSLLKD